MDNSRNQPINEWYPRGLHHPGDERHYPVGQPQEPHQPEDRASSQQTPNRHLHPHPLRRRGSCQRHQHGGVLQARPQQEDQHVSLLSRPLGPHQPDSDLQFLRRAHLHTIHRWREVRDGLQVHGKQQRCRTRRVLQRVGLALWHHFNREVHLCFVPLTSSEMYPDQGVDDHHRGQRVGPGVPPLCRHCPVPGDVLLRNAHREKIMAGLHHRLLLPEQGYAARFWNLLRIFHSCGNSNRRSYHYYHHCRQAAPDSEMAHSDILPGF